MTLEEGSEAKGLAEEEEEEEEEVGCFRQSFRNCGMLPKEDRHKNAFGCPIVFIFSHLESFNLSSLKKAQNFSNTCR